MKKTILMLFVIALLPMTLCADALRDTVPSNYGGWVNLTDGFTQDKDYNNPKMEVAIDGNTLHLCWMEITKIENIRKIWYRRSIDLGKTWEDARVVMEVWEPNSDMFNGVTKVMAVSNGHVHIAAVHNTPSIWGDNRREGTSRIYYMRSDDNGQTFGDVKELGGIVSDYFAYSTSLLQCDGNTVVIGSWRWDGEGRYPQFYFYSTDCGDSFTTLKNPVDTGSERGLLDLQVSGTRFAALYRTGNWYSGLIEGKMMVLCCDGSNMEAKNIAPLCIKQDGEQVTFAAPNVMTGGNGDSFDYHPQMVLDGESLQVMYRANPGKEVLAYGGLDYAYTLYQRTDDFGQTWNEPIWLPESNGGAGTIAAKGDNVYIVTTFNGLHTVYHSNDKGATFQPLTESIFPDNVHNPAREYHLAIDPSDPSGDHAYFSGNRFFYVETHDGFRTINRNFCLGAESWTGTYYGNNHALKVYLDQNGQEYWFMKLCKPTKELNIYGSAYIMVEGSRDIMFRRVEAEPAPRDEMALSVYDFAPQEYRVAVPMTPSLQLTKAITVECWIKTGNANGFNIANCTNKAWQQASEYNDGWFLRKVNNYWDRTQFCFDGCICTDAPENNRMLITNLYPTITLTPSDDWHHVVLTYDDNIAENNACVYVDGMLAASNTIHGNLTIGRNPIALGPAGTYDSGEGLLDNFAVWSRALTAEEVKAHAANPKANDGKDNDCRVLLTFDGTLKDSSNYGNDAVALMDITLTEHSGIDVDGITTPTIDSLPDNNDIYSIDGRKMDPERPLLNGIYIKNGQKIIVR